jgi:tetratricopeptide (TPR) repeat protein
MSHRNYRISAFPLALLLFCAPAGAASRWLRLEAGRWQILTDASEKTARETLTRLTAAEQLFELRAISLGGQLPDPLPPVRVLLCKSARDLATPRRSPAARSLFVSAPGQDYILLADPDDETARVALHELFHLVASHTLGPLPAWLEEGLAEYHSTARLEDGQAVLGIPVATHVAALASPQWAAFDQFSTLPASSGIFYAQAWATVHFLLARPDGLATLARFVALLRDGHDQAAAFSETYGMSIDRAMAQARSSLPTGARRLTPLEELAFTPAPTPAPKLQEASEAQISALRAELALSLNLPDEAARLLDDAAKRWPKDATLASARGTRALAHADYAAARREFEAAIALGDARAETLFEYAMLLRDSGGEPALVVQSLRKAVEAQPAFGEAWFVLGNILLTQGDPSQAADCLAKATALLPRRGPAWEAYGRALSQTGQLTEARQAAQHAVAAATSPEQSETARGLLREVDATAAARPAPKVGSTAPRGWEPPKGDATVSGKLALVNCDASTLKFAIQTRPGVVTLLETATPQTIMLRGAATARREFVCGPQPGPPAVTAGYISRPAPAPQPAPKAAPKKGAPARKAAPAVAGELVWLQFE